MRDRSIRILFRLLIPAFLCLAVLAIGLPQASLPQPERRGLTPIKFLERLAIPGTNELQLIIELADAPVVQAMASLLPGGAATATAGGVRSRPDLGSAQALAYRAQIARAQRLVTDRLNGMSSVEVQGSTDLVMNAIIARPETNAKVNFLEESRAVQAGARDSVLVPRGAIVSGPAVFLLLDQKAARIPVTLGAERNGRVEVVSGLEGGERIIVGGLDGLADGMAVTLKK